MKKAKLLFFLLLCSGTIYCQVKPAGWQYSYEKKFKVREQWGGYESSNGPYYSKYFVGEAECMASANLLENKKTSNNIYEWIRYRIVKGCSCNSSLPNTDKKPAITEPNKSVSQSEKLESKLNPNDAGLMQGMSEAIYNSQQSSIDEKNRRNEQNANRYAGGRPSSEQSYNLPILNGGSKSDTNQPTNESKNGEVLEYDSDDDGIVDTRRTTVSGQAPVYEKIENTRPLANLDMSKPIEKGQDGFITEVNTSAEITNSNISLYYFNGVMNFYGDGLITSEDISNMTRSDVHYAYSATSGDIGNDVAKANLFKTGTYSDEGTQNVAAAIYNDLLAGKEVRVMAHSRGFAWSNCVANDLERIITERNEVPTTTMSNLTIIGLGGFTDQNAHWPDYINVIPVSNSRDPVPYVSGNGVFGETYEHIGDVNFRSHPVKEYYKWIPLMANPKLNPSILTNRGAITDSDYKQLLELLSR